MLDIHVAADVHCSDQRGGSEVVHCGCHQKPSGAFRGGDTVDMPTKFTSSSRPQSDWAVSERQTRGTREPGPGKKSRHGSVLSLAEAPHPRRSKRIATSSIDRLPAAKRQQTSVSALLCSVDEEVNSLVKAACLPRINKRQLITPPYSASGTQSPFVGSKTSEILPPSLQPSPLPSPTLEPTMCKFEHYRWICGHESTVVKEVCNNVSYEKGPQDPECTQPDPSGLGQIVMKLDFHCPRCLRALPEDQMVYFSEAVEGAYRTTIQWYKNLHKYLQDQFSHWHQIYQELALAARNDPRLPDRNDRHILLVEGNDSHVIEVVEQESSTIDQNLEIALNTIRPNFEPLRDTRASEVVKCADLMKEAYDILDSHAALIVKLEASITARQLLALSIVDDHVEDARMESPSNESEADTVRLGAPRNRKFDLLISGCLPRKDLLRTQTYCTRSV